MQPTTLLVLAVRKLELKSWVRYPPERSIPHFHLLRDVTVLYEGSFIGLQLAFAFPKEVLYGADLAWTDGGGLDPEGVADQQIEFRSRFHRFRPRDSECPMPHRVAGFS